MVVKNKNGKMEVAIRQKGNRTRFPDDYLKTLNPTDANDLSLLFEDLEGLFEAPIDKAFRTYRERKGRSFPFA